MQPCIDACSRAARLPEAVRRLRDRMGGLWDRRKKPSNARNDRELSRDILGVCAHQPHRRALEMVVKVTVWLSERWT